MAKKRRTTKRAARAAAVGAEMNRLRWAGTTKAERSATARRAAMARWHGKKRNRAA